MFQDRRPWNNTRNAQLSRKTAQISENQLHWEKPNGKFIRDKYDDMTNGIVKRQEQLKKVTDKSRERKETSGTNEVWSHDKARYEAANKQRWQPLLYW